MMQRLGRGALALALGAIIVVGLLVAVLRVVLAHTDGLDDRALQAIAVATDKAVSASAVSARLNGLAPELELRDVRLGEGERALRFASLALALDPWESLWHGTPVLEALRLDGGHLRVTRFADGRLKVQGHEGNLLARMPFPDRVSLTSLTIDWRDGGPGVAPLRLRGVELSGAATDAKVALSARAVIADNGGEVQLRGNVDAPLSPSEPLTGQLHLALTDVDAARISERASRRVSDELGLGGRWDGAVWLTWRSNRLVRGSASGDWLEPAAFGLEKTGPITGTARWQRQGSGWRVDARWPADQAGGGARVSAARDSATARWRLGMRGLELGDWFRHVRAHEAIPERWRGLLRRVQPRGHVDRLQLARQAANWRVEGELAGLSLAPGAGQPGIDNLALAIAADPDGGRASLGVSDGRLRWPAYLTESAMLSSARGQLFWRVPEGAPLRLRLGELTFAGPLAAGRASGLVDHDEDGQSRVDGELRLSRGDASGLLARVEPELREKASLSWLAAHLQGGRLTGTVLRASGPVSALGSGGSTSVLRLRSGFRANRLDYAEAWPALTGLAGDFELSPEGLRVRLQRARVAGLTVGQARARLLPDWQSPQLDVELQASAAFDDWRKALKATPLAAAVDAASGLRLDGEPSLDLSLRLPLADPEAVTVDGQVRLRDAGVAYPATGYRLTQVQGDIGFDREGLEWDGLTARFGGSRVTSNGWTVGTGEDARIRAIAQVDAGLAPWLPAGSPDGLPISGRSAWLVDATLPGLAADTRQWRVELSSDLSGLAVDAPAPFGKTASEARALSLRARGGPSGMEPVRLQYGRRLRTLAAVESGRLTRVGIQLGSQPATLPDQPGLRVDGRVEALDAAKLRDYSDLWPAGGGASGVLPGLLAADLEVGSLQAGGHAVRELGVLVERPQAGWRIRFDGANARGTLTSADGGGFELAMERLAFDRVSGGGEASLSPPLTMPTLDVRIGELRLDGRLLGQLRVRLEAVDDGVALRELVLDNPSMLLRASGNWDRSAGRSRLEITTETVDTGGLLDRFGLPARVKGGQGRFRAELSWAGHLLAPDVGTLAGTVELDLRDGSLPTLEPGASRVFGLLSLSLLPRRLMLDFAPITHKGLPFDRIYANFDIADGVARPNPCYLVGPLAQVQATGAVDLVDRVYDQRLTVTPRISATLPLVGVMTGGAPAALLLWLGQDVVAEGMAPFTSLSYRLTGPWSAPRIDRMDTGLLNNPPDEEIP